MYTRVSCAYNASFTMDLNNSIKYLEEPLKKKVIKVTFV
jgi:hypothetical protein